VIANKKFWEGLPADVRGSARSGDEGIDRLRQQDCQGAERQGSGSRQENRQDAGLCADSRRAAAFKKALAPVHVKMESRIGKDLLQSVYKETGFDPTKF
jgi:C4-dicarboxylate-binding protein DctP